MALVTKTPGVELELPLSINITPSKISPWRSAKLPGAKFTHAQLREMVALQIDPVTVATVTVRSAATIREYYWPTGQSAPVFVMPCPILRTRERDGSHLVISPNGQQKWVRPNGDIRERRA